MFVSRHGTKSYTDPSLCTELALFSLPSDSELRWAASHASLKQGQMADLVVVIVSVREGDFLRHTLPRSKRALPDAKFVVAHLSDDHETASICSALKVFSTVSLAQDVLTRNGATFNVSALISAAQARVQETLRDQWIVLTRPQVVLDSSLAALPTSSLEKKNVYGSFFEEIHTQTDLLRFQTREPTAAEVRDATPSRQFLLFHGSNKWPSWSKTAAEGEDEFLSKFPFQFMVQMKLAHLGSLQDDKEGRTSTRWEERNKPADAAVKIAPVHAGATQNREEKKEPAVKEEEKKKDEGPAVDKSTAGVARREVDAQNMLKPKREETELPKAKPTSNSRKNPFKAVVDTV